MARFRGFVLPFARTLAPAAVIDDPALMIAFVCGLAAVTTIAWSAAHLRCPSTGSTCCHGPPGRTQSDNVCSGSSSRPGNECTSSVNGAAGAELAPGPRVLLTSPLRTLARLAP